MKKLSTIIIVLGLFICIAAILLSSKQFFTQKKQYLWSFESIDTMKYSRDLAREKLSDSSFDETINRQVKEIAGTGATHIAIATPYDEEFYPILKRWVDAARKEKLHVWFRGNFSGWEEWFSYPKITRDEHLKMTRNFLLTHPSLFRDGDIFTACPECENGGPGDPRQTGDTTGFRKFLIDEYSLTKSIFAEKNLNVRSNFDSMNLDVANLVMDSETTKALDGIVTVDHYVKSPEKLNDDITNLAQKSGGKVVLGEFGAPIPDLTGGMTELEQSNWLEKTLELLSKNRHVEGVNYWVGEGGSTQLWDEGGKAKLAVKTITKYYFPK